MFIFSSPEAVLAADGRLRDSWQAAWHRTTPYRCLRKKSLLQRIGHVGRVASKNTKSVAGEHFLLLDCRGKPPVKGMFFPQTPVSLDALSQGPWISQFRAPPKESRVLCRGLCLLCLLMIARFAYVCRGLCLLMFAMFAMFSSSKTLCYVCFNSDTCRVNVGAATVIHITTSYNSNARLIHS